MSSVLKILPHGREIKAFLNAVEKEVKERYNVTLQLQALELDQERIIDSIAQLVSSALGVPMNQILSKKRSADITEARFIISFLCMEYCPDCTVTSIAKYFDQHHTSTLHGQQKMTELLSVKDEQMTAKYLKCKEALIKKMSSYE